MPSQALYRKGAGNGNAPGAGGIAAELPPLLGEHDPPPYRVENSRGRSPILLTCDHASYAIPASLGTLGVSPRDLKRHIGWDPGASAITLRLSKRFDAKAILSSYSRLIIDCNRRPHSETSILTLSDGTPIPGNMGITASDVETRIETLFKPYHRAISSALEDIRQDGMTPVFVAIHSFTPKLNGHSRPWHFGVLWDEDARIARPLIEALRADSGAIVGDNEPYSARDHFDFSQEFHASSKGLPSALVEIRSDLIQDESGVELYADLLGNAMEIAMAAFQSGSGAD